MQKFINSNYRYESFMQFQYAKMMSTGRNNIWKIPSFV